MEDRKFLIRKNEDGYEVHEWNNKENDWEWDDTYSTLNAAKERLYDKTSFNLQREATDLYNKWQETKDEAYKKQLIDVNNKLIALKKVV